VPFSLSATASSGLALSYASSNTSVATVSGSTVTIVGAGTTDITASQAGNANYTAASDVVQTLTVNPTILSISSSTTLSSTGLTDDQLAGMDITVIGGEFTMDRTTGTHTITVKPGAKLTLNDGSSLDAGTIQIQSTSSGTGTFVDKNSGLSTVTGNVQQYLTSGRNWYISCPVNTATTASLNSANSIIYYDEPTAQWLSPTAGSQLTLGKGYVSSATLTTGPVSFNGVLNSGTVIIPLTRTSGKTKEGFNLVGNPYPSYLDWSKVDATSSKILSSVWFRTQTDANVYTFDTYNGKGNVSTNLGATKVTNLIPPMQAFWVRVKQGETGGTLTFTNAMRSHADYTANTFKAPVTKTQAQQLLRLEVSNGVYKDQTLVYFNENALNEFDAYDSPKMTNGSASIPEIYTVEDGERLVINGMKNLSGDIELPLGFTTGQADSFSIKASEITDLDDTDIILKDKLQNEEFNLKNGEVYTFVSDATTTDARFAIIFKTQSVTTALKPLLNNANIHFLTKNDRLTIINDNEVYKNIPTIIYNAVGQEVVSLSLTQPQTTLDVHFSTGMYIVSLKLANDIITQKFIIK